MNLLHRHCLYIGMVLSAGIFHTVAAQVTIKGTAAHAPGEMVSLGYCSDHITQSKTVIKGATIDAKGAFTFSFDTRTAMPLLLFFRGEEYTLYTEPDSIYEVMIVPESGYPLSFPEGHDTNELNFAIGRFNYDFNKFTVETYEKFISGQVKADLARFSDSVKTAYAAIVSPYFHEYMEYKMVTVYMAARSMGNKKLFETYFKDRPIAFQNPEFMYAFTSFYDNFLLNIIISGKGKYIQKALINGTGFDSVVAEVSRAANVSDMLHARLISAYGLMQSYYSGNYNKTYIANLAREALAQETNEDIHAFLQNMIRLMDRLKNGSEAPLFSGKDAEGNSFSLESLRGKPVYLSFLDPNQPASIKEISGIKALYDKYKRDGHFLTVCSSCTYSSMAKFMKDNDLKWKFWVVDPQVDMDYEVMRFPAFFIIDKTGVLYQSPAKSPGDGVEQYIYAITQKVQPQR